MLGGVGASIATVRTVQAVGLSALLVFVLRRAAEMLHYKI